MDSSELNVSRKLKHISKDDLSSSKSNIHQIKSHKRSSLQSTSAKKSVNEDQKLPRLAKSASCSLIRESKSKSKSKSKQKDRENNKNLLRSKTLAPDNFKFFKTLTREQLFRYDKKIRRNNKKYVDRNNSSQNIQMRLPWGVDQPRLNNYVLETLAKMQKLRRAQCQPRQDTFQTQKSQIQHQSDQKQQLTPKKTFAPTSKPHKKQGQKVIKSPTYEQKTNKKQGNKKQENSREKKILSEQPTEKQRRNKNKIEKQRSKQKQKINEKNEDEEGDNNVDNEEQMSKQQKISSKIARLLSGEFQCLEKNKIYAVNFRVVNKKIIQLEIAFFRKIESIVINLNKGSLECQSIHEQYHDIAAKTSIILMTAVSTSKKCQNFLYPQLHIVLTQKNNSFSLQKKILLPYSYLFLLQIITTNDLKTCKLPSKIKNKSVLQQIPYKKELLLKMQKIFDHHFIKYKIKEHLFYLYGFRMWGEACLVRVVVTGGKCLLECQSSSGAYTKQVLEMFQSVLRI